MGKKDPRVDKYIDKAEDFAKPILKHIRELVHKAAPGVEETLKWGMPYFDYKGPLCAMSSFKNHATFGFWKAPLMKDPHNILDKEDEAMGQFGRITRLEELPADEVLISYIEEAWDLNERGVKHTQKKKSVEDLEVPEYFMNAVSANKNAKETFESFSYSHRKEYVEWVTEAKTEATRQKRLQTAVEWMSEGKGRNWKYERKK